MIARCIGFFILFACFVASSTAITTTTDSVVTLTPETPLGLVTNTLDTSALETVSHTSSLEGHFSAYITSFHSNHDSSILENTISSASELPVSLSTLSLSLSQTQSLLNLQPSTSATVHIAPSDEPHTFLSATHLIDGSLHIFSETFTSDSSQSSVYSANNNFIFATPSNLLFENVQTSYPYHDSSPAIYSSLHDGTHDNSYLGDTPVLTTTAAQDSDSQLTLVVESPNSEVDSKVEASVVLSAVTLQSIESTAASQDVVESSVSSTSIIDHGESSAVASQSDVLVLNPPVITEGQTTTVDPKTLTESSFEESEIVQTKSSELEVKETSKLLQTHLDKDTNQLLFTSFQEILSSTPEYLVVSQSIVIDYTSYPIESSASSISIGVNSAELQPTLFGTDSTSISEAEQVVSDASPGLQTSKDAGFSQEVIEATGVSTESSFVMEPESTTIVASVPSMLEFTLVPSMSTLITFYQDTPGIVVDLTSASLSDVDHGQLYSPSFTSTNPSVTSFAIQVHTDALMTASDYIPSAMIVTSESDFIVTNPSDVLSSDFGFFANESYSSQIELILPTTTSYMDGIVLSDSTFSFNTDDKLFITPSQNLLLTILTPVSSDLLTSYNTFVSNSEFFVDNTLTSLFESSETFPNLMTESSPSLTSANTNLYLTLASELTLSSGSLLTSQSDYVRGIFGTLTSSESKDVSSLSGLTPSPSDSDTFLSGLLTPSSELIIPSLESDYLTHAFGSLTQSGNMISFSGILTNSDYETMFSGSVTSFQMIAPSQSEMSTPSQSEMLSLFQSEMSTPSRSEMSTPSQSEMSTLSQSEMSTPSQSEMSTPFQSEMITPSQSEMSTLSQSEMSTPSQGEMITPTQSEMSTLSQSEMSTPSQSEMITPAQSEISSLSQSEMSTPSQSEMITPSQSEMPAPSQSDHVKSDLTSSGTITLQHSDLTPSESLTPLLSDLTSYVIITPLHSDLTPSGSLTPQYSDLTPSGTVTPLFSDLTPYGSLTSQNSDLTPIGTMTSQYSDLTPMGTLTPLHSDLTPSGSLTPQYSDLTPSGLLTTQHSDLTPYGTITPLHSDLTPSGTLTPQYSDLIPSGTITPQHSELTPSGSLTPQYSDLTSSGLVTPQHSDLTSSGLVTPQHSDLTSSGTLTFHLSDLTPSALIPLLSDLTPSGSLTFQLSDITPSALMTSQHSDFIPPGSMKPFSSELLTFYSKTLTSAIVMSEAPWSSWSSTILTQTDDLTPSLSDELIVTQTLSQSLVQSDLLTQAIESSSIATSSNVESMQSQSTSISDFLSDVLLNSSEFVQGSSSMFHTSELMLISDLSQLSSSATVLNPNSLFSSSDITPSFSDSSVTLSDTAPSDILSSLISSDSGQASGHLSLLSSSSRLEASVELTSSLLVSQTGSLVFSDHTSSMDTSMVALTSLVASTSLDTSLLTASASDSSGFDLTLLTSDSQMTTSLDISHTSGFLDTFSIFRTISDINPSELFTSETTVTIEAHVSHSATDSIEASTLMIFGSDSLPHLTESLDTSSSLEVGSIMLTSTESLPSDSPSLTEVVSETLTFSTETLPLSTETISILTETLPLSTETLPLSTETLPLWTETLPLSTETISILTETLPLSTETLPLSTETLPLSTETISILTETLPLSTETLPLSTETLPLSTETLPLSTETISILTETLPLSTETLPLSIETISILTETLPLSTETLPLSTETISILTETLPLSTETLPLSIETISILTETLPLSTETLPLLTESLPLSTETLPLLTESLPLSTETLLTESLPLSTETLPLLTESLPLSTETLPLSTETLPLLTESLPLSTESLPFSTETLPLMTESMSVLTESLSTVTEGSLSLILTTLSHVTDSVTLTEATLQPSSSPYQSIASTLTPSLMASSALLTTVTSPVISYSPSSSANIDSSSVSTESSVLLNATEGLNSSDSYMNYWIRTVLIVGRDTNVTTEEFQYEIELKLANAYDEAYQRQNASQQQNSRRKRMAVSDSGDIKLQINNITRDNTSNEVELIYLLMKNGSYVPAVEAVGVFGYLSDQEVALRLGYVVVVKAETYLPQPVEEEDKMLWIIGAVLGPIALFLLIWLILCIAFRCCRRSEEVNPKLVKMKRSDTPPEGGNYNRQGPQSEDSYIEEPLERNHGPSLYSNPKRGLYEVNPETEQDVFQPYHQSPQKKSPTKKGSNGVVKPEVVSDVGDTLTYISEGDLTTTKPKPKTRKSKPRPRDTAHIAVPDEGEADRSDSPPDQQTTELLQIERKRNKQRLRERRKVDDHSKSSDGDQNNPVGEHRARRRPSKPRRNKLVSQPNGGYSGDENDEKPAETLHEARKRMHQLLDDAFSLMSTSTSSIGSSTSKTSLGRLARNKVGHQDDLDSSKPTRRPRGKKTRNEIEDVKEIPEPEPDKKQQVPEKKHTPMFVNRAYTNDIDDGIETWTPYRAGDVVHKIGDEVLRISLPHSEPIKQKSPRQEKLITSTFVNGDLESSLRDNYHNNEHAKPIEIQTKDLNDTNHKLNGIAHKSLDIPNGYHYPGLKNYEDIPIIEVTKDGNMLSFVDDNIELEDLVAKTRNIPNGNLQNGHINGKFQHTPYQAWKGEDELDILKKVVKPGEAPTPLIESIRDELNHLSRTRAENKQLNISATNGDMHV